MPQYDNADSKIKKTLAFKSTQRQDDDALIDGDDDMAMIPRKFMKFLANKRGHQERGNNYPSSSIKTNDRTIQPKVETEENPKCYHC